jgi:FkbH-like protein
MVKSFDEIRDAVESSIEQGHASQAWVGLGELWNSKPLLTTAQYVISCAQKMGRTSGVRNRKVAFLRSFTVEPVLPLLRAECLVNARTDLEMKAGDFNTYAQDILAPESFLEEFEPEAAILAVQTRDVVPELWERFADLNEEDIRHAVERTSADFECWITCFRQRTDASLLIHLLDEPELPKFGILDGMVERSQARAIQEINARLQRAARATPGVYVLDYPTLVARWGRREWYDERKWLLARLPIAPKHLHHLAQEWARYLGVVFGRTAKVAVTDLDNTLWKGVVGEDGPEGLKMDQEHPGAYYRGVQRALLDLSRRGILLAIASKNNLADALQVIEKHPDMLLRPADFAAIKCNWLDKAQNLRAIAEELNVGLDSLVFIDDNPVERDLVRQEVPEVSVLELPAHAEEYERVIREFPLFERLALSREDRERGRYYAEQRERDGLKERTGSLEEFFYGLKQIVEIRPVSPESLARAAQLTQKTNQFNLTTRRYTEAEMAAIMRSGDPHLYEVRVQDRFGDNGIVGICVLRNGSSVCEIDNLLLSCRVIGRTVETALLSFLAERCRMSGCRYLQGWFLPTAKNAPAKDFYRSHNFVQMEARSGGETLWSLDLDQRKIECPKWISLRFEQEKAPCEIAYSS